MRRQPTRHPLLRPRRREVSRQAAQVFLPPSPRLTPRFRRPRRAPSPIVWLRLQWLSGHRFGLFGEGDTLLVRRPAPPAQPLHRRSSFRLPTRLPWASPTRRLQFRRGCQLDRLVANRGPHGLQPFARLSFGRFLPGDPRPPSTHRALVRPRLLRRAPPRSRAGAQVGARHHRLDHRRLEPEPRLDRPRSARRNPCGHDSAHGTALDSGPCRGALRAPVAPSGEAFHHARPAWAARNA